jgi:hypothetical protein
MGRKACTLHSLLYLSRAIAPRSPEAASSRQIRALQMLREPSALDAVSVPSDVADRPLQQFWLAGIVGKAQICDRHPSFNLQGQK